MSEPEVNRPGSVLRAEREALGVTIREVAETLNLSMTVIEALEADDYERLPGPVFARGYVRAYARLLELPPEPLVAQYPRAAESVVPVAAAAEAPVWEWIRRRPGLVLGGAAAAGVLLLVLVTASLWPQDPPAVPADPATEAAGGPDDALSPGTTDPPPAPAGFEYDAAGNADTAAAPPATGEVPARESAEDPGEPGRESTSPAPDDVTRVPTDGAATAESARTVSDGPAAAQRITPAGEDRLRFEFTDDCWVEVRSGAGRPLYSDLNRAGSALELVGEGPFRILLGYAPGAQLAFNGESVPLAPHTRDNVATLVLGQ